MGTALFTLDTSFSSNAPFGALQIWFQARASPSVRQNGRWSACNGKLFAHQRALPRVRLKGAPKKVTEGTHRALPRRWQAAERFAVPIYVTVLQNVSAPASARGARVAGGPGATNGTHPHCPQTRATAAVVSDDFSEPKRLAATTPLSAAGARRRALRRSCECEFSAVPVATMHAPQACAAQAGQQGIAARQP